MKNLFAISLIMLLTACSDAEYLAKINGELITQEQFNNYLKIQNIPQQDKVRVDKALDIFLQREALAAAISKEDLLDKKLIEAEVREYKKQTLISRYFDQVLKNRVTDDAVTNYYASHSEQYQKEKVHIAHILLRTRPKMSDAEKKVKMIEAQEVWSKLETGKAFEDLAKDYSDDKVTAGKGGDLGWMEPGAIAGQIDELVAQLKVGEYSKPIMTNYGFHIVKVLSEPQIIKQPIAAVKGNIRYQLEQEAKQAEKQKMLDSVKVTRK